VGTAIVALPPDEAVPPPGAVDSGGDRSPTTIDREDSEHNQSVAVTSTPGLPSSTRHCHWFGAYSARITDWVCCGST